MNRLDFAGFPGQEWLTVATCVSLSFLVVFIECVRVDFYRISVLVSRSIDASAIVCHHIFRSETESFSVFPQRQNSTTDKLHTKLIDKILTVVVIVGGFYVVSSLIRLGIAIRNERISGSAEYRANASIGNLPRGTIILDVSEDTTNYVWTISKTYPLCPGGPGTSAIAQSVRLESTNGVQLLTMFRFSHRQFKEVLCFQDGDKIRLERSLEVMDDEDPDLRHIKVKVVRR